MNARAHGDLLDVGGLLVAGEVGAGDRYWPRSSRARAKVLRPLDAARQVLEDHRPELDELVFLRRLEGELVDVALGVVGGWAPRLAVDGRGSGWSLVGGTGELLVDEPEAELLALRLELGSTSRATA